MMKSEDTLRISIQVGFPKFTLDVTESISLDGVTGLEGESGAGKSTIIRVIAGIERTATGTVSFRGRKWMDTRSGIFVPAHKRAAGIVFQDGRLFSHLSVERNLGYGFRRRRGRKGPGWDEVGNALDLGPLLPRKIQNLSGGEQQRVALGRALLSAPELLLLDEPLASLDGQSKEEIIPYLGRVISTFGIPAIYISHSNDELRSLVDNILVVQEGRVVGRGGVELNSRSGQQQFLRAKVVKALGEGFASCSVGDTEILARSAGGFEPGTDVALSFQAGDLAVTDTPSALTFGAGTLPATIEKTRPGRNRQEAMLGLRSEGGEFYAQIALRPAGNPSMQRGGRTAVAFIRPPQIVDLAYLQKFRPS